MISHRETMIRLCRADLFTYWGASYAQAGGQNSRKRTSKTYVVGGGADTRVTRLRQEMMGEGDETKVK